MKYTDTQLLTQLQTLDSFTGLRGIVDIWVRCNQTGNNENTFCDKVYTFDCTGDTPKFVMVCTGTSHAGSAYLRTPDNPLGCAVLKSNEIVYNSHVHGMHKGEYPAYVENAANPFPYFRDANRNLIAEEIGPLYRYMIGANCHHAGLNSQFINNWSAACLVRNVLSEFNAWMNFMDKRPLSVAILREF